MFEYGDALEHAGARVEVVFCGFFPDPSYNSTVQRFQDRWPGRVVELGGGKTADSSFDFNAHLSSKVTHLYAQLHGGRTCAEATQLLARSLPNCMGNQANVITKPLRVKLAVHAVFDAHRPWGDAFARISSSVPSPRVVSVPVVPLIAPSMGKPGKAHGTGLRVQLGIPVGSTVFCSYGGQDSFNTRFVQDIVCELGAGQPEMWFVFANHKPFCRQPAARVRHLPNLVTQREKVTFIATCDAMLHARLEGETFGMAVAEFSMSDKPILVYSGQKDKAHIQILGPKAIVYMNALSLKQRLLHFNRTAAAAMPRGYWCAYHDYTAPKVMETFCSAFYV